MNNREIQSVVLTLLNKRHSLDDISNIENLNFFEQGIIDSISLIKFVIELEDEFDIDIDSADIALKDFKTVNGLAVIISSKINAK